MHAAYVDKETHTERVTISSKSADSIKRILKVGPRGIKGLFGWTFFDPANLVCVAFLGISAMLTVISMRDRLAADWYMPIGLYLCLATLLRGYIFNYYHGRAVARFLNLLILVSGLLVSAILWGERATEHEVLREGGIFHVAPADGFHVASLMHLASAIALAVHFLLPRHWLIRMTDQMVERAGQDEFFAEEAATIQLAHRDSLNDPFGTKAEDECDPIGDGLSEEKIGSERSPEGTTQRNGVSDSGDGQLNPTEDEGETGSEVRQSEESERTSERSPSDFEASKETGQVSDAERSPPPEIDDE